MVPADRASEMAKAIAEAMNTLAAFVCPHAFRGLPEATPRSDMLRRVVADLGHWPAPQGDPVAQRQTLDALARLAARPDAWTDAHLAEVRGAAVAWLAAFGISLPELPEDGTCRIHGATCPEFP